MKKIALLLLTCCASVGIFAQISIGPIVGTSLTNVNSDLDLVEINQIKIDQSPIFRYYAGIQTSFHFSEKIIGGLGLEYQGRGFKYGIESPKEEFFWEFNYLSVIPNFEFKPVPSLGILAGASIGFKLSEQVNENDITSLSEYANPVDIGGILGLKYYFNENLYLNLSYFNSLVSISDIEFTDENGNAIGKGRSLNQSLSLGVGYNFYLKK